MSQGFLPDWLADSIALAGIFLGVPGIILFLLNKKGANRKLVVEEGGLTVAQFNAALPAYMDLLDREKGNAEAARIEIKAFTTEREEMKTEIASLRENQRRLYFLFLDVVRANNIQLTSEQQHEFESTKPRPRIRKEGLNGTASV